MTTDERIITILENSITDHRNVVAQMIAAVQPSFVELAKACCSCLQSGGKILFCGNGGSAADCQHIATELTIRFRKDRPALAALALTTDTSALTACGNDIGLHALFARQVEALAKPGDILIGISTSGNSENVIEALTVAARMGCTPAGFGGKGGGKMRDLAKPFIIVPSSDTARIQEMHILIGHMLCDVIEHEMGFA